MALAIPTFSASDEWATGSLRMINAIDLYRAARYRSMALIMRRLPVAHSSLAEKVGIANAIEKPAHARSEERRVGKECRTRGSVEYYKKNKRMSQHDSTI